MFKKMNHETPTQYRVVDGAALFGSLARAITSNLAD